MSSFTTDGYPDVALVIENSDGLKPFLDWFQAALETHRTYQAKARYFLQERVDYEIRSKLATLLGQPQPAPLEYQSYEAPKPLYHATPDFQNPKVMALAQSFLPPGIPDDITGPLPSDSLSDTTKEQLVKLLQAYTDCPARVRLSEELTRSRELLSELCQNEEMGWKLTRQSSEALTYYRSEPCGNLNSFKVVGLAKCSLVDLFAVIYEAELYTEWFPMMAKAAELQEISRFHKVVNFEVSCPWPLSNRDIVVEANGVDDTARGRVLINSRDLPTTSEFYLPASNKLVRANLSIGGYMLELVSPQCTRVSFYCNVDAKLVMPSSILNLVTGKIIHLVVSSMEKMAQNVRKPGSKFLPRIAEHAAVYEDVKDILRDCFGEAAVADEADNKK